VKAEHAKLFTFQLSVLALYIFAATVETF